MTKEEVKAYHENFLKELNEYGCSIIECDYTMFNNGDIIILKSVSYENLAKLMKNLNASVLYFRLVTWDDSEKELYMLNKLDFEEISGINSVIDKHIKNLVKEHNAEIESNTDGDYLFLEYYFIANGIIHTIELIDEMLDPPDVDQLILGIKQQFTDVFNQIKMEKSKEKEGRVKLILEKMTNELVADKEFIYRRTKDSRKHFALKKFEQLLRDNADLKLGYYDITVATDKAWAMVNNKV